MISEITEIREEYARGELKMELEKMKGEVERLKAFTDLQTNVLIRLEEENAKLRKVVVACMSLIA